MSTKQLPFTEPEWKIPGYTGYVQGMQETYKKTPIMAQLETKDPAEESFIYTRTITAPVPSPSRDPCNFPENFKKPEPGILWPALQEKAIQDSFKPPRSNIAFGDDRVDPFKTSYGVDFHAPFEAHERLRSPMRNKDLAETETSLKEHYVSAYNRVGEKRLAKMIETMRERLEAKLGNSNNNAFRMRTLFKMYDKGNTGMIHFEDLRTFFEKKGVQLDDDSLLALCNVYDPEGTGFLKYEELVSCLLDADYFAFYVGNVDNTQARVDLAQTTKMMDTLKGKFVANIEEMRRVFHSFDTSSTGYISRKDFKAGCAALGVVMNPKEEQYVLSLTTQNDAGQVQYEDFCSLFS